MNCLKCQAPLPDKRRKFCSDKCCWRYNYRPTGHSNRRGAFTKEHLEKPIGYYRFNFLLEAKPCSLSKP